MSLLSSQDLLSPTFSFSAALVEDEEEGFVFLETLTLPVLEKALIDVLFALPMGRGTFLPNPKQRFCLDLRKPSLKFLSSKAVRRVIGEFDLVVKTSLKNDLAIARRYHEEQHGSTWLNESLIALLDQLSTTKRDQVQLYSFSLVEKSSGRTTASSFGFRRGNVFEDFTACTLLRDKRSCGAVLNRVVGALLREAGIALWYWGYEVPYMNEYRKSQGAGEVSRQDFYRVLQAGDAAGQPRMLEPGDITLPGIQVRVV